MPPNGMLYLENVTAFRAIGVTLPSVETHVRKVLSEKLVSPQMGHTLLQVAPATALAPGIVSIAGAVATTGPRPLGEGLRAYEALGLASEARPWKALDVVGGSTKEAGLAAIRT